MPIRVGQIGTSFRYRLMESGRPFDVSADGDLGEPDTMTFVFLGPGGIRFTRTPTNVTDGTDGLIQWTTTASTDFVQEGRWQIQPVLEFDGGAIHYWEPMEFLVGANL